MSHNYVLTYNRVTTLGIYHCSKVTRVIDLCVDVVRRQWIWQRVWSLVRKGQEDKRKYYDKEEETSCKTGREAFLYVDLLFCLHVYATFLNVAEPIFANSNELWQAWSMSLPINGGLERRQLNFFLPKCIQHITVITLEQCNASDCVLTYYRVTTWAFITAVEWHGWLICGVDVIRRQRIWQRVWSVVRKVKEDKRKNYNKE